MKKQIIISALMFTSLALSAQENGEEDTLKIKWKGSKIWIFEDKTISQKDSAKKEKKSGKDFTHWGGFDLGVCALSTVDDKFNLPQDDSTAQMNYFLDLNYSKSWYFSLNLIEKNIRLYKNYANLVTGLGFEWNQFNFRQNISLASDAEYTVASDTTLAFKKNKLKATFIKAPLLIELNTNNKDAKKSFHIAGGLEFAYKLQSKTKQVYEVNGYEYKIKKNDDYNLAPFRYSAVVRLGYGDYFTVFGNYALSELFESNKGPEVYPICAGIAFTF